MNIQKIQFLFGNPLHTNLLTLNKKYILLELQIKCILSGLHYMSRYSKVFVYLSTCGSLLFLYLGR